MGYTSREDFDESWLTEMPMGVGEVGNEFFYTLLSTIREFMDAGLPIVDLGNGYKRMAGETIAFYWYEENNTIIIAIELSIKKQSLVVNRVGRNPDTQRKIHASDLYDVVLKDNYKALRLMSDDQLSDNGYKLWKRLLSQGKHITVYDSHNPGSTMQTLNSIADMDEFFKHHAQDFKRWQYVLSDGGVKLAETRSYFNTRRYRELSGLL